MWRLRSLTDGDERAFSLEGEEVLVGRGSDNQIVLPDFSVSRRHAAFRFEGRWFVYDLQSTNGVQINRLTVKKAPLRAGDQLKIGIFEFVVESDEPEPSNVAAYSPPTPPPLGAHPGATISSATIIRRLADFSADYNLEAQVAATAASGARSEKRAELDQAYANRIFGFLTRLGRLLSKEDSVDEVLGRVIDIAFEALPVDRGFILLTDEESGTTICELAREGEKTVYRPDGKVPVSDTMVDTVTRERVALLTYDAQSDQRLAGGDSIRIHQIRAAMCSPLWSGERIIGVMQVDSPFHTGTFNEKDLDLFTALANFAAVAVERIRNAQRAEQERQMRNRLERYHSPAVIEAVLKEKGGADGEVILRKMVAAEVTVLFADVVGFTSRAETAPPAEIADLLRGYFTHSVEAIFEEAGTLDKFIGDCVMAFFGAPIAQVDHALRGVRAAVAIQRRVDAWNKIRGGSPLQCRIALNSGPVVVGDVGSDTRVDYTVLGNTVNVASRLESSVASPGEIIIGAGTVALLDGTVKIEALGDRELKGLQQRIPAWRVDWRH